ncbi:right-handed parallel beta-helix repeat-containing protein [Paenibacillus sp. LjRoot56]|uniref:right-handed parallel beta-helix repeat-containing protein n=1 Tax=Paenibacillus sp. LjRoot56 TaxID=3342333 RepID=UPI003ECE7A2A
MLRLFLLFYATFQLFLQSSANHVDSQNTSSPPSYEQPIISQQDQQSTSQPRQESTSQPEGVYQLELDRWQIYNDNSHAVETTNGFNKALQWAHEKGFTVFKVPAGTYLIAKGKNGTDDPEGRINMVSDMTFMLDPQAVIQKETNSYQDYSTLLVGVGMKNVIITGGTYRGDRDTHDYSSGGTHESGYGILFQGAINSRIDGVKALNFTGDGLCVGGGGGFMQDVYEDGFESGGLDDYGSPIADSTKVRTKMSYKLTHASFDLTHAFIVDNGQHLSYVYDIYFYKEDGIFLSKIKQHKQGQYVQIPQGAHSIRLAFSGKPESGQYVEIWNRVQSTNVIVQNSESSFNRRQGLTINGGKDILIQHNSFHDIGGTGGTAPMAGIDVEGGAGDNGFINENIMIKNNEFYNNSRYDVIFYDGHNGTLENNHLASKGAIGLAVSDPFTGAVIKDNHFDGTSIYASHDVAFIGNVMNDSKTHFEGPRVDIKGMTFKDAILSISSTIPYGVTASDIQIQITKNTAEAGLTIWKNPVHLTNVTIQGAPALRSVTGEALDGNIFDNLKVLGYNSKYGLELPPGTYNQCVFEAPQDQGMIGPGIGYAGTYQFNECSFKGIGLQAGNAGLHLTVQNSIFEITGNRSAIAIDAAASVEISGSRFDAMQLSTEYPAETIRLKDDDQIQKVSITGNTITTNIETAGVTGDYVKK